MCKSRFTHQNRPGYPHFGALFLVCLAHNKPAEELAKLGFLSKVGIMNPAFNRMWASSIVSNLSDGVMVVAVPLLAISLTDSPVLISSIGAMVMLPWLLFAIPIGVLVDRVDRRYILAGANAIRSGVVGVLALPIARK